MMFISKDEAIKFIYSSYMKASSKIDKTLSDRETRTPYLTRELLDKLGQPDRTQKNIVVTGSKGKGSVSRIVSKLLQDCGYKVGLFTSPHLVDFNERIRINGRVINDEDLIKYINKVYPYVREIDGRLEDKKYIGPVGITAVIASLYFKDNNTDYNVFECGRGARYDDVNMLKSNWGIINTVFPEHIPEVGYNLEDIAYNKSGVIKENQEAVFIGKQEASVIRVMQRVGHDLEIPLKIFNKHFFITNIKVTNQGTTFDLITENSKYENLEMKLLGRHQVYNAALAINLVESILGEIDIGRIRKSLGSLTWPGRMEIIDKDPMTILDGCINRECAKYIKEIIDKINKKPIVVILGIPDNKDYEGVFGELAQISDTMIITRASNNHLLFTNQQFEIGKKYKEKCYYKIDLEEAIEKGKKVVGEDGMLCIIGTQSLIRDVKILYKQDTRDLD